MKTFLTSPLARRISLVAFLVGCAAFLWLGAKAQDIGTPINDGANTAVTIKHRLQLHSLQAARGGRIEFFAQRVKLNNADDSEIVRDKDLIPTSRPLAGAFLTDTVTVGGNQVTGQQFLTIASKFWEKYYAEDHP